MRSITLISSLLLTACAGHTVADPQIVYRDVPMQVATPCVVDRPAPVVPLNKRVPAPEWAARAQGAKAQAIRAQAGVRMNYEGALAAATAGCPEKTR